MNGYATMCSGPVQDCAPATFETIPNVVDKSFDCLCEATAHMQKVFKLLFGDDVPMAETPKCENLTQSVEALSMRANDIRRACQDLAERLGA